MKTLLAGLAALGFLFSGCAKVSPSTQDVLTVNPQQSAVKWQSIGNCWVYASVGWVEALVLRNTGEELDLSETYLTFRHWEDQLSNSLPEELETGGSFAEAVSLMARFGVMREGDFIPSEEGAIRSLAQKEALDFMNTSLKEGRLSELRTTHPTLSERRQVVREELEIAFGIHLESLQDKIIPAKNIVTGFDEMGAPITLRDRATTLRHQWRSVTFPLDWSSRPLGNLEPSTFEMANVQRQQLRRVKRALNDDQPVLLSWFVDFNALRMDSFSRENLEAAGEAGRQGGHLTVIEDYVVSGTRPDTGEPFSVGEGQASPEEQRLATEFGEISYFIIKNSWGQKPESSYLRDGSYGYHKIFASYLFSWLPERKDEESTELVGVTPALRAFVLPPGY